MMTGILSSVPSVVTATSMVSIQILSLQVICTGFERIPEESLASITVNVLVFGSSGHGLKSRLDHKHLSGLDGFLKAFENLTKSVDVEILKNANQYVGLMFYPRRELYRYINLVRCPVPHRNKCT